MKPIEMHAYALQLMDLGFKQKKEKNAEYIDTFKKAFFHEKEALEIIKLKSNPLTKYTFYRSSANLAFLAYEFEECELLIHNALSNRDVPAFIKDTLYNMLQDCHFQQSLNQKNREIANESILVSIEGDSIAYGMAPFKEIRRRTSTIIDLIKRSLEILTNKVLGELNKAPITPYIKLSGGSLSVEITFDIPTAQTTFLDKFEPAANFLIQNFIHFQNEEFDEIRTSIKDENQLLAFLSSAKFMLPDGKDVAVVKLTKYTSNSQLGKEVILNKTPKSYKSKLMEAFPVSDLNEAKGKKVEVIGTLDFASAKQQYFKITDSMDGKIYRITGTEGIKNIIKDYWEETVSITGIITKPKTIQITSIDPVNEGFD